MVRMRWLALAFVVCTATTARAQATQQKDSSKAKSTMTKPAVHKAPAAKMEQKAAPKTAVKGSDTAAKSSTKTVAKSSSKMTKSTRKSTKAKKDTATTKKGG